MNFRSIWREHCNAYTRERAKIMKIWLNYNQLSSPWRWLRRQYLLTKGQILIWLLFIILVKNPYNHRSITKDCEWVIDVLDIRWRQSLKALLFGTNWIKWLTATSHLMFEGMHEDIYGRAFCWEIAFYWKYIWNYSLLLTLLWKYLRNSVLI